MSKEVGTHAKQKNWTSMLRKDVPKGHKCTMLVLRPDKIVKWSEGSEIVDTNNWIIVIVRLGLD